MPTELRTTSSAMLLTEPPVATPTVSLTAEQVLRMEMLMHKMAQALQDPHADARYRLMEHLVSQFHQARAEASERESAAPVATQQPQAPSQQPVSSTSVASLAASDMASDDALLDVDDATDLSTAALVAPAINGSGALAAMSTSSSSSSSSASQHENKERQALILRANVLSFRRLSRNLPLTPELRSVVTKTIDEAEEWDGLSELVSASGEPLSLPVPTPPSGRTEILKKDREKRIHSRLANRAETLQRLIPDLPIPLRVKAEIELSQLLSLQRQRQLRQEVLRDLMWATSFKAAQSDPMSFTRQRKNPGETRGAPTDAPQRDGDKRQEFVSALLTHFNAFRNFHAAQQKEQKKVNSLIIKYHTTKARREQMQREREQKERLRALRENDEDAYIMLLKKTKNDRLHQLLSQTDEYLNKISDLIQEQKLALQRAELALRRKAAAEKGEVLDEISMEIEQEVAEAEAGANGEKGDTAPEAPKTKTYYAMAHSIEEEIKEQPSLLTGGTLKPYQLLGIQWLVSLYNNGLNGILADEMGLGKTIQTIALVAYLKEKKFNNGPFLIIVPLSTLSNWTDEFAKWAPSIKAIAYKGDKRTRKALYQTELSDPRRFNVVICQYESIINDKSMLGKIPWNYIIVDEGHRMKNKECRLTTVLAKDYNALHRLLLTGTPLQNKLPELWSLLNFLLPTIFNSVENFEQWFNAPFASTGEEMEITEEETLLIINRLHKVLRPFLLRRLKQEVEIDLPDKVEHVLICETSALQKRMYRMIQSDGRVRVNENITSKALNNTMMQLRKVCNHPYLFYDEYMIDEDLVRASGKLFILDRMLLKFRKAGHKVLVFSQMKQVLDMLEDYLNMRGLRYLRLDGTTKADLRGGLLQQFNKTQDFDVFILSTRAGGLGLNLQTADTVIIFDSDWNPQMDLQAQDRAHRIGQKSEVRVYRLICQNSIEEYILDKARFKLDIDAKIIKAGMYDLKSSAQDRRTFLESLLREQGAGDQACNTNNNKKLNRMLARNKEEFELYEQVDREADKLLREKWKAMGHKKALSRLMSEDELPVMQEAGGKQAEDQLLDFGRGRRERPEVCYVDGLTDKQWERLLETGEVPKRKKRTRRAEEDDEEEVDMVRDATEEVVEEDDEEEIEAEEEDDSSAMEVDESPAPKRRRTSSSSSASASPRRGRRGRGKAQPTRSRSKLAIEQTFDSDTPQDDDEEDDDEEDEEEDEDEISVTDDMDETPTRGRRLSGRKRQAPARSRVSASTRPRRSRNSEPLDYV